MATWQKLISDFGGPKAFSLVIDVSQEAARQMSHRNSVHSIYWSIIVARAPRSGVDGITFEFLASLRRGRVDADVSVKSDPPVQLDCSA